MFSFPDRLSIFNFNKDKIKNPIPNTNNVIIDETKNGNFKITKNYMMVELKTTDIMVKI